MISIRSRLHQREATAGVNMAPLIDLVFLLLIFFMVTTSFVKETGVDVQRPTASTAVLKEKGNILIAVDSDGRVFFEKKHIDIRSVRAHIERSLAENPEGAVVFNCPQGAGNSASRRPLQCHRGACEGGCIL